VMVQYMEVKYMVWLFTSHVILQHNKEGRFLIGCRVAYSSSVPLTRENVKLVSTSPYMMFARTISFKNEASISVQVRVINSGADVKPNGRSYFF
jgi:hypothetical protein